MNKSGEYMLNELQRLDPARRADVVRILDGIVQGLPAHWRRRKGVPQLMVFLDGPENVRVERTTLWEMSKSHGYLDELHRWVGNVPVEKAKEHGCAALVYGNRIHARINQIGPIGSAWFSPDSFAQVSVVHGNPHPLSLAFSLTFDVEGRIFPRLVFHEWVFDTLARARRG
ncbi:hypothetical protein [Streptomyces sp. JNUCC 63]